MRDEDLLRQLRGAIEGRAPVTSTELIETAWEDAVAEARSVLQALMTKALLEDAAAHLQSTSPRGATRGTPNPQIGHDTPGREAAGTEDWVWYVYGVTSAEVAVQPVTGVGGHETTAVLAGRLQAIAARVPADQFGEEPLADRLKDLQWLSREAQAHEAVLAEAVSNGPALPLRFGTVYRSRDRVVEFLTTNEAVLGAQVERLRGHHEWSVKALADRPAVEQWARTHDPEVAALEGSAQQPSDGHEYFVRKRQEQAARASYDRICSEVAAQAHERLTQITTDATTARPQDPSLSGYDGEMVLNGIYLVSDAAVSALQAAVAGLQDEHAPRGFQFVVTGPWPPHHFVDMSAVTAAARVDA